jgi:23S rRNA (adenine2503-C2)-methyltransferase
MDTLLPTIHDLTREALAETTAALGQPRYRADQLWHWLYRRRAASWDAMRNLPAAFRAALAARFEPAAGTVAERQAAPDGTVKLLVRWGDGESTESVLIPAGDRRTLCLSTQVGCRLRCAFCASGRHGWTRDLSAGEIVRQVLLAADAWGERPTHVVYMGIGDPLDNIEAVLPSLHILNDAEGLGIGARRITISTSGLVPGLARLAADPLQVELAVSLHAPDDATRSQLMPVNRRYPLDELLEACRAYTAATRRLITFEYVLIRGVNDSPAQARELAARLARFPSRVNLIPLSPVEGFDGAPAGPDAFALFARVLGERGINVTRRDSRGGSVRAACGQLRSHRLREGAAGGGEAA